jgi:hypothetical protein
MAGIDNRGAWTRAMQSVLGALIKRAKHESRNIDPSALVAVDWLENIQHAVGVEELLIGLNTDDDFTITDATPERIAALAQPWAYSHEEWYDDEAGDTVSWANAGLIICSDCVPKNEDGSIHDHVHKAEGAEGIPCGDCGRAIA